eukprot:TRINITY_DN65538_c0_g1_i1.p1 TRINITY_DN65538_c0_g1~~TRINITY_DN65538_c0_g1_i1.p1  ORF type:complete len:408 (+),score=122.60 TRINITY_DN65538_c0_g1_i1:83-1225(+)
MAASQKTRLVLHFDINETIMVGDPSTGQTFADSLNNLLAKATCVRRMPGGDYQWHDGTPLSVTKDPAVQPPPLHLGFGPPPEHDWYYFAFRGADTPPNRFADDGQPGAAFRPLRDQLEEQARWKHAPHPHLEKNGKHFLLPAFFRCICELSRQERDFAVVIRTMGQDIPEVAACIDAFSRGEHADFPPAAAGGAERMRSFATSAENSAWALQRARPGELASPITMKRFATIPAADVSPDLEVLEEVSDEDSMADRVARGPIIAVRDQYSFWSSHNFSPAAGKPVWVTVDDHTEHHIIFDDNIHDKSDDSIAGIRARSTRGAPWRHLSGDALRRLQGVHLVRVHACEVIRDQDYFLKRIEDCEAKLRRMREDGSWAQLLTA